MGPWAYLDTNPVQLAILACLGLLARSWLLRSRQARAQNPGRLPLPPGPKGHPLIGNLLQFPQVKPWEVYNEWRKQYGDVIYLELLSRPVVILNSLDSISEFLETDTANTADRPLVPTNKLIGLTFNAATMRYGDEWRANRKGFRQCLNTNQVPRYHALIEEEVSLALRDLARKPEAAFDWARNLISLTLMRTAYGIKDFDYNAKLIADAEDYMERASAAAVPGRYFVNAFAWLRKLPNWRLIPGMGWRRELEEGARLARILTETPYRDAKEQVKNGSFSTEHYSIVAELVQNLPSENTADYRLLNTVARNVAASTFSAGAETTISSAQGFFLAMAMYPEVQKKAQAEIDIVTENGARLPTLADKPYLPYLQALLKELARWHTVTPLGVPHQTISRDEYKGYFIPRRTGIFANAWAVMHDERHYDRPFVFEPERFLRRATSSSGEAKWEANPDVLDPYTVVFGHGRRICPGRHLSIDVMACLAMSVLAAFEIKPAQDAQVPERLDGTTGLVTKPIPFGLSIRPRSEHHATLMGSD